MEDYSGNPRKSRPRGICLFEAQVIVIDEVLNAVGTGGLTVVFESADAEASPAWTNSG
jgi:hypothetical protein